MPRCQDQRGSFILFLFSCFNFLLSFFLSFFVNIIANSHRIVRNKKERKDLCSVYLITLPYLHSRRLLSYYSENKKPSAISMGLAGSPPFLTSSVPLSAARSRCCTRISFDSSNSNSIPATASPADLNFGFDRIVVASAPPVDLVTWLLVHGPS